MKNTFQTLILAASMFASTAASAAILCKVQTEMGPAQVEIKGSTVTVTGAALKNPQTFNDAVEVYDGHATSLITAPGLAISYRNVYGCIRDAKITTNFRTEDDVVGYIDTAETKLCTGGSTNDEMCK